MAAGDDNPVAPGLGDGVAVEWLLAAMSISAGQGNCDASRLSFAIQTCLEPLSFTTRWHGSIPRCCVVLEKPVLMITLVEITVGCLVDLASVAGQNRSSDPVL